MKNNLYVYVFLSLIILTVGCASTKYVWKSHPNMQQASNEYYAVTISPIYIFDGYKGFLLYVHNKSPDDIEIDWKNTFHIYNGKTAGGFIFRNMRSGDRLKTPAIVSGSIFSKEIFPAKLAEFSTIAMSTVHDPMGPGENGVSITVSIGGKQVTEKLTLQFSKD